MREAALRTGTEVVLQTVPVDPRSSSLQGDYAILDYEIAGLPSFMEDDPIGETVYVSLREEGGLWKAAIYGKVLPSPVGDVFIEGRIDRPGHLDFGIGTYFVPEGTGRVIETAEDVKVVVSVDSGGNAVIKEVLVDGKPFDPDRDE